MMRNQTKAAQGDQKAKTPDWPMGRKEMLERRLLQPNRPDSLDSRKVTAIGRAVTTVNVTATQESSNKLYSKTG